MRIVFIGCVQFSAITLKHTISLKNSQIVGIVTKRRSPINADFISLSEIADEYNIPFIYSEENSEQDVVSWIAKQNADVIYCFGWSHILSGRILNAAPMGVIGYHPAPLPQNRGRHPLIWTLVLGLKRTASTFFFLDEGADSGDILSQVYFDVSVTDDAASLYSKLVTSSLEQISSFTAALASKRFDRIPQDHSKANYWRKRSIKDGVIDWRMSSITIINLIRGLSRPYVGAHFVLNDNQEIKVWRADAIEEPDGFENVEPGRVIALDGQFITVKCGIGFVKLIEHEMKILPQVGVCL